MDHFAIPSLLDVGPVEAKITCLITPIVSAEANFADGAFAAAAAVRTHAHEISAIRECL